MAEDSPQSVVRRFNARLRDLLTEPCAIVDARGVVHSANLSFCERVGAARGAVEGRALGELSPWSYDPVVVTRFIDHVLAADGGPVHALLDPVLGLVTPTFGDPPQPMRRGAVEPLVAGRVAPGLVAIVVHPISIVGAARSVGDGIGIGAGEPALSALHDAVSISRSLIALSLTPHITADQLGNLMLARLGLVLEVVELIETGDGRCELSDLVALVLRRLGDAPAETAPMGARVVLELQLALVVALVLHDVLQRFRRSGFETPAPSPDLFWRRSAGADETAASELVMVASGLAADDDEALQHDRFAKAMAAVCGETIEQHHANGRLRVVMRFALDPP